MKTVKLTFVGMQYRLTLSTRRLVEQHVNEGTPVKCKLVREPENLHDKNAIKVMISTVPYVGMHIGYITRHLAEVLAPALDSGDRTVSSCTILELNAQDGSGLVEVKLKTANSSRKKKAA
jgi:hypothetical protein